jgi:diguanylate cyclase (GGDEF)-like protein
MDTLKQQAEAYSKIFDIVRMISPLEGKVINFVDNKLEYQESTCFSLWSSNNMCKNCITKKAFKKKDTFCKIQHNGNKMFLVFATPIEANGQTFVLELLKDITDNLVFETVDIEQGHEVRNIIEDLNTLILHDSLTDLYNRRYIKQMIPVEIAKSIDKNQPLSIAMVDIDHFKNINDTFGHTVGDVVLKKLGKILFKAIRGDGDWVARYGGEEFLVCLPNTDNKKAYKILERMREKIEKSQILVDNNLIQVTASFGLYSIIDNNLTAVDLINCADSKLYEAKKLGRNKVVT